MISKRPNIIVFLTDDQGYGDLGIYGNPDLDTPHIDRIGREGLCLNQHYTASPICAPARAAFLTGRYNWPRIEEAMQKMRSDNPPYQKNFEVPHFLMNVENPPVERTLSPPGDPELYNIKTDPHENINLAQQQTDRVHRMKRELETWFEAIEADRRRIAPL